MNELGIVLVVVFTLILVLMFFNRGIKRNSAEKNQKASKEQTPEADNQVHASARQSQKNQQANESEEIQVPAMDFKAAMQEESVPEASPLSKALDSQATENVAADKVKKSEHEAEQNLKQSQQPNEHGGKHYVLEVDDPAMTGELDEQQFPPAYQEPKFGRPEANMIPSASNEVTPSIKQPVATAPKPKAFVLVIKTQQAPLPLERIHHVMQGVGAKLNNKQLYTYATKPIQTDGYVTIANLLEPGTFPTDAIQNMTSPGVVLILELPTFVTAQAAMHDMIMLARKLVQHFQGQILDEDFQVVKESYLQSMREQSLEYDSQKIVT